MRVTVVVPDNKVVVNGEPRKVELPSSTPNGLHAIQWFAGDSNLGYGELEFQEHNETHTDDTFSIAPYIRAWRNAEKS